MSRILVLSGAGRYADPWHPFAATSERIAAALRADGHVVEVREDVDAALVDADRADVLVVNAGDPWRSPSAAAAAPSGGVIVGTADGAAAAPSGGVIVAPADETVAAPTDVAVESLSGLQAALRSGAGVLAMHAAVASLRDYPSWAGVVGGVWLPGLSTHPPIGRARVTVRPGHPVTDGVHDFELVDERYCRLQRTGESEVLATHRHAGRTEPTVWVRTVGASRIVYDSLGHDERSFDSPEHVRLVRQAAAWVARAPRRSS